MKSIIKQLFDGELNPGERIFPSDPDYADQWENLLGELEQLLGGASEEKAEQLEHLEALICGLLCKDMYAGFAYGLRLGAGLCLELLTAEF